MNLRISGAALAACLFLSSGLPAQSLSLLVLSKQDHTLAIVDPSTLQVVAKAPVGEDPHEVIASSDGSTAYVSNYGFGLYNNLYVIDLATAKDLPQIDLGPLRGPHGLTFVGGKTWFTAEAAKAIGRYDPATKKVDWIMGTGQNRTHMIFVSDDQKLIVTSNVSSGTVSIFEMQSTRQSGPPPGGPRPNGAGPGGPPNGQGQSGGGQGGQRPGGPRPGGPPGGPRPPGSQEPAIDWNETVVPVGRGSEGFDVSPDPGRCSSVGRATDS
jgi:hypothetical protein